MKKLFGHDVLAEGVYADGQPWVVCPTLVEAVMDLQTLMDEKLPFTGLTYKELRKLAPKDIWMLAEEMCDKYVDEGPSDHEIVDAVWAERQYWQSKLHAVETAVRVLLDQIEAMREERA